MHAPHVETAAHVACHSSARVSGDADARAVGCDAGGAVDTAGNIAVLLGDACIRGSPRSRSCTQLESISAISQHRGRSNRADCLSVGWSIVVRSRVRRLGSDLRIHCHPKRTSWNQAVASNGDGPGRSPKEKNPEPTSHTHRASRACGHAVDGHGHHDALDDGRTLVRSSTLNTMRRGRVKTRGASSHPRRGGRGPRSFADPKGPLGRLVQRASPSNESKPEVRFDLHSWVAPQPTDLDARGGWALPIDPLDRRA